MNENWVIIYTSTQLYEAEYLRDLLMDNGIECVLMNKIDSLRSVIGEIELYVLNTQSIEAKQLIPKS